MSDRKSVFIIVLVLFLVFSSGCNQENNESGDNDNNPEETQMIEDITEIENNLLEIMQQADLVPVVEVKTESEEEDEDEEEAEAGSELTYEETILSEVLERELENGTDENGNGEDELPESTEEIWDSIKMTIADLHAQWDELEPVLIRENISEDTTDRFGEGLNSLTAFGSEEDHLEVLTTANELTWHLSHFLEPFTETSEAVAYEAKYHVRNIVIESFLNNYDETLESIEFLKSKRPVLTDTLEKEDAEELETSLNNLERALDNENPELVKLKSALVMENLVEIIQ